MASTRELKCTDDERKAALEFIDLLESQRDGLKFRDTIRRCEDLKKLVLTLILRERESGKSVGAKKLGDPRDLPCSDGTKEWNFNQEKNKREHLEVGLEEVGNTGEISQLQKDEFNYIVAQVSPASITAILYLRIMSLAAKKVVARKPTDEALALEVDARKCGYTKSTAYKFAYVEPKNTSSLTGAGSSAMYAGAAESKSDEPLLTREEIAAATEEVRKQKGYGCCVVS